MIYCDKCEEMKEVVSYDRDNPVLSCDHVKLPKDTDAIVDIIVDNIERKLQEEAERTGTTVEEQRDNLYNGLRKFANNVDYCHVCRKEVSVFKDNDGKRRCCGDMISDAGCGCEISSKKIKNNT